jgi:hypothetical protein
MKRYSLILGSAALILIALLAIGCGRHERQRLAIAYVIDMTGSVESDAIQQAFDSLQPLLNNKTLKRGDSITIIPITGDTLTESQGKILRIHLPENREVYDSDLMNLAREVEQKLKVMQSEAAAKPYQHSDILGAADLASEELSNEKGNVRKVILILSDFIQDDSRFNFNTSPDLANDRAALALARKLSTGESTNSTAKFNGTAMYLGMLRSKDLKRMPNPRREAVQTFWREYFKNGGAGTVSLKIDGPSQLAKSLG